MSNAAAKMKTPDPAHDASHAASAATNPDAAERRRHEDTALGSQAPALCGPLVQASRAVLSPSLESGGTDAREAEGSGLLSRPASDGRAGSNPAPSASLPGSERAPCGERGVAGISEEAGPTPGNNGANAAPLSESEAVERALALGKEMMDSTRQRNAEYEQQTGRPSRVTEPDYLRGEDAINARGVSAAWRSSPDVKQLDALSRRFPSVGRLRRAAQDLNGAMVAYHREHPLPDEFLQEHLALTALLAPPKEAS